jgi:hypothetical protein
MTEPVMADQELLTDEREYKRLSPLRSREEARWQAALLAPTAMKQGEVAFGCGRQGKLCQD